MEKNYSVTELGGFKVELSQKGRVMVGEVLGLTGCEISFNCTAAGQFTPFVHKHDLNEEVYIVLSGEGEFMADGQEFPIKEGSVIRVAPAAERAIKAGKQDLTYICIQAQAGSLTKSTADDGILTESKASWMK